MRQYGLLAPLDHARLTNLPNLERALPNAAWDPQLEWVRSLHVGRHRYRLQPYPSRPRPRAWADLWSARLKGRLTMLDDPEDVLGACLKKLRLSYSSTAGDHLRRAEHEAIAQKPLLRAYLNAEVSRPAGGRRCAGRAALVDHRAAGHRRRAAAGVRLSRRGFPAVLR